ncbi:MAG TPA: type II secretion system protein GspK [Planctomycetota bacterium]
MVRLRSRDRGIALILALLVLVLLIVLVGQMAIGTRQDRVLAENRVADLQNTYGARAGYHRAALVLQADLELAAEVDSLGERWAQPIDFELGQAKVSTLILDCERFISLAQLVNDKGEVNPPVAAQLRRLVRALRHPPDTADRIIDYIDADNKGSYESRARNERLMNAEELLRVEGLAPETLYGGTIAGEVRKGLLDFVTVWPRVAAPGGATATPGAVNVNTAPQEVLEALSDEMTPALAGAVAAFRMTPGEDGRPQGFKKVEDLKSVPGLGALYEGIAASCVVKASTFEIRARSTVRNVEKAWVFVAQRGQKGLTLLSQQRLNDFATAKPPDVDE